MIKKGDKVKRIGRDFRGVKQGEVYTCRGTENMNNIYLEETNGDFGYAKDKFEKVEEFKVGEGVIWKSYNEKVEIRGFSSENTPIIEDKLGNILKIKSNRLSKLRSKSELKKGDKIKNVYGNKLKILAKEYDDSYERITYFVKYLDDGVVSTVSPNKIDEVIYNES